MRRRPKQVKLAFLMLAVVLVAAIIRSGQLAVDTHRRWEAARKQQAINEYISMMKEQPVREPLPAAVKRLFPPAEGASQVPGGHAPESTTEAPPPRDSP